MLSKYNKELIITEDEFDIEDIVISNDIYFLMMQFGIPIGIFKPIDSRGNEVFEWSKLSKNEKIKYLYTPINSVTEYYEYIDNNLYTDLIVNPNYMNKNQVRNISYCLEFANDSRVFDFDDMINLQIELIDSAPLNYENAMKIFNRYYTEDICNKFIYDFNIDEDRFYFLSGLDRKNIRI